MKKNIFLSLCLFAVCFMTISCKKDNANNVAPASYDGTWSGTTSQGKSFSFNVSGGSVSNIYLGYSLSGNCSPSPIGSQLYSNYAINGKSFSTTGSLIISGSFSSGNNASGSFTINFTGNPTGCSSTASGTWSAAK